jgi:hypothetical protein
MRQLETQKKLINIGPRNIGGFIPGTNLSLVPFATGDSRRRHNTNSTKKDIEVIFWRHDNQHNDIQYNGTQHMVLICDSPHK